MGYYDRPYRQDPTDGGPGGGFAFGGGGIRDSIVVWIIGINIVVFFVDQVLEGTPLWPFAWGAFTVSEGIQGGQVWRFITYQFLHAGLIHILFNMLILYFLGPMVEQWLGSRRFLVFYLLCGCSGAVLYSAMPFLIGAPMDGIVVGASGSVYGVIIGCAVIAPRQTIHLLGIIPMTLRTLALFVLGLSVVGMLAQMGGGGGGIAHTAHIGGAALGFLLIKKASWLDFADSGFFERLSPSRISHRMQQRRTQRRLQKQHELDREVDRILEKVARDGLHSLTRHEKKVLQQATDQRRQS